MTKHRNRNKRKPNYASAQIQTKRNINNAKHWQGAVDHANMLKEREAVAHGNAIEKSRNRAAITHPQVLVHRVLLGRMVTRYQG